MIILKIIKDEKGHIQQNCIRSGEWHMLLKEAKQGDLNEQIK